jgi:hypothetical protein
VCWETARPREWVYVGAATPAQPARGEGRPSGGERHVRMTMRNTLRYAYTLSSIMLQPPSYACCPRRGRTGRGVLMLEPAAEQQPVVVDRQLEP